MQKTSSRLLALLSLLQTPRDWSGEDLAGRLDVTSRTVRRDIDRLRDLGYPITTVKGPAGGYRLEAGTRMPPSCSTTARSSPWPSRSRPRPPAPPSPKTPPGPGHPPPGHATPPAPPHRPAARHRRPAARGRRHPEVDPQVLMELSRVIHARQELRLDHTPGPNTAAGAPRRVQPHHLVTWRHRWYLVAWDLDRGTGAPSASTASGPARPRPPLHPRELPGGDVSTFLTSRFRGNDGTSTDWPCRGEVILHLPAADVAPFARDGTVEELGPHHCRLTLGSWSWTGLAAVLGHFDTDVEVVGPPQLATAFADLAARYARAAGPGTGPPP
ncbi:WYL domain-containing protein [Streptomyces sp. Tue 6430]|nr:WYL domain-containing protein [Streptomyces sp. Tue 6430]